MPVAETLVSKNLIGLCLVEPIRKMKIVLSCGHANADVEQIHAILRAGGVRDANPSESRALTPQTLIAKMFDAHEVGGDGVEPARQLLPGKFWQELAADLLVANIANGPWGWADAKNVWALDFWSEFDAQVRFVLVYSSPEAALGRAFLGRTELKRDECDRVLAVWTRASEEMLRFYSRHPHRCVLVNAAAVQLAPAKLNDLINQKFAMSLDAVEADRFEQTSCSSPLATCLARLTLLDCDPAHAALWGELESIADIDGGSAAVDENELVAAWKEHAAMLARIEAEAATASRHAKDATLLQTEIEVLRRDAESQREQFVAERAKAASEISDSIRRLEEQHQAIEQLSLDLDQLQQELLKARALPDQLRQEISAQVEENELLLLQLHQMQDELAHLNAENQLLHERLEQAVQAVPTVEAYSPVYQQSEWHVDMTKAIDGDNWYYAETDGRWAGPQPVSAIRVPPLLEGTYDLALDIVDAKAPDIIDGMEIALNGKPLSLQRQREGVVAQVRSRFTTSGMSALPSWEFVFRFPRLISPAEQGSEDTRVLAVRLRSLLLARAG
jgi:hypothetical protein